MRPIRPLFCLSGWSRCWRSSRPQPRDTRSSWSPAPCSRRHSARSRALDRYARATPLPPGSDAARVLEAMRHAQFSVWRIKQRHDTAGLIITDVLREADVWLVDEQLEASAPEGLCFAGRICEPDRFAMGCGVVVPVYP